VGFSHAQEVFKTSPPSLACRQSCVRPLCAAVPADPELRRRAAQPAAGSLVGRWPWRTSTPSGTGRRKAGCSSRRVPGAPTHHEAPQQHAAACCAAVPTARACKLPGACVCLCVCVCEQLRLRRGCLRAARCVCVRAAMAAARVFASCPACLQPQLGLCHQAVWLSCMHECKDI